MYGLGEYIHANGDEYVGEWKDNLKHGHGEYTHANGDEYVGLWKDGIQYDGDTKNQLDNQKLGKSLNELWNRVFKNDKSVKNLEIEDSKMKLTPTPIEKDFLDALYGGKALRKLFNVKIINFDGFFETDTIYYAEVKAIIEEKKLPEELRKSIYRSFLRENGASFSEAHILAETIEILSIFNNGLNMFIDGSDTKNSDINMQKTLTAALRFGKGKNKWIYIPDEKVSIETNETYNTDFQGWVDKYSNF